MSNASRLQRVSFGVSALATVLFSALGCSCRNARGPAAPGEHPWRQEDPIVQDLNEGVAWMERYEYAKAVEIFERAAARAPSLREAKVNLAIALFNRAGKDDISRSAEILDGVLADDPEDVRANYLRAMVHRYAGEDDRAVERLSLVVRLRPHDACAWYFLGTSKANLGQDPSADLERAVQANPNLASAYFALFRAAALAGRREEAAEFQKKFAALRENAAADTVVSPDYRRIGPLAVVRPLSASPERPVASAEAFPGKAIVAWEGKAPSCVRPFLPEEGPLPPEVSPWRPEASLALADADGDGALDFATNAVVRDGRRGLTLFFRRPGPRFEDATEKSGIRPGAPVLAMAFGDYDNDGKVDLFLACAGPNELYRGRGDGTFEDVTAAARVAGSDAVTASAFFLDADHDSDLDLFVANVSGRGPPWGPLGNELLQNRGDGTFADIALAAGVALGGESTVGAAPLWADADRDLDLVLFLERGPPRLFLNELEGRYREAKVADEAPSGGRGGIAQDFDGDGLSDLFVVPGPSFGGALYLSGGDFPLRPSAQARGAFETLRTWGEVSSARVADIDLDGDLDVVVRSRAWHALLNDGSGRLAFRPNLFPEADGRVAAWELADGDGDGAAELIRAVAPPDAAGCGRIEVVPLRIEPPQSWIAIAPTGDRGVDKRTRSPASGYGARIELRAGLHSQTIACAGLSGGPSQSLTPVVFGLDGASKAEYVAILWPDGVTQTEVGLAAGERHRVEEIERRMSSCPVLFAWDGERFEFVSDFAGVGGLGYYLGPGTRARPEVLEHVKIDRNLLRARDGRYELRVVEAMEEVAYVDRLELLAVDHPEGFEVYPDERLSFGGPAPTRRLLSPERPIYPARALDLRGAECTERILRADRLCAYPLPLDRRFPGFAARHALILEFGDRLEEVAGEPGVYLFLRAWIEYPYSQTVYAARQAGVAWEPIRVEASSSGGAWQTIVPDAGAPGGLDRTIAIDLTGKIPRGPVAFRLSTNMEISIDQAYVAKDRGAEGFAVRSVPLESAVLGRLGFPREFVPEGDVPPIYSYETIEPESPFKLPAGAYTRYGPVEDLLREFDDRYAILGSGDEIALRFDAGALPPVRAGEARSFVLVSHAWCKDMDLYTAEPDTVEPLPFRGMSSYPYAPPEGYPETEETARYRAAYNARIVPEPR
ncbi:MAG: FG-GAP-like repeat-containing protein [Planctomycetota bacterium]